MRISLIVAAGGRGERFARGLRHNGPARLRKPGLSKLFLEFSGRPLLARTVSVFLEVPEVREILLAVPRAASGEVRRLARAEGWCRVKIVIGGKTRAESVLNALRKADRRNPWVMVHDGARPFVSRQSVRRLIRAGDPRGGVVLARKVVPTIKQVSVPGLRIEKTVDRSRLVEAETPQLMPAGLLRRAYREAADSLSATDEASLLEKIRVPVRAVDHGDWNPKITTPEDLKLARAYFGENERTGARTGFGRDTHRLVPGRKFYLGGVRIPFDKGALGHSDADTLLHAVADAVLGAAGAGDIGERFPDSDPRYKNMRSDRIVRDAVAEARGRGWIPDHADTVITLERPKLLPYKALIRKKIAGLLNLPPENVSVKAKTMEGLGPEGEGRAVTCEALVTLRREV